jgi:ChpA-C
MRMWAKGTTRAALLTASFVALGAGPALADGTNGDGSILGGNQVNAPISVPVDISGNALAVLGRSVAGSTGGTALQSAGAGFGGGHSRTSGRHSIGGGNQIDMPVNAPVNACGNSAAVLGDALAGCHGGSLVGSGGVAGAGYEGTGHHRTSGRHSILGGNQVHAPVNAPVNVCGNSAALLGDALAGCRGGATAADLTGGGFHGRTSGRHSIGGGNQLDVPVNAPVNVCGNAIGGDALAGCHGGASVAGLGGGSGFHGRTSGHDSILGGNQLHAPVNAPIDVCGNTAAVLGDAVAGCAGGAGSVPGAPGVSGYDGGFHGFHGRTSGRHSIGGGNQVHAPIYAPVDVCGNAAAVLGRSLGSCGADGGHNGYNGDDCITPSSARMSGLPQLPVDPDSLGAGAMPVAMGATPALPKLPARPADLGLPGKSLDLFGRSMTPQSSPVQNLTGGLHVPSVGGPPKELPPVKIAAAESSTGSQSGALLALVLGGMFAASAGTISVARRITGRR